MNKKEIIKLVNSPQRYSEFATPRTFEEISQILGVSRQYVNEIYNNAMRKLLSNDSLKDLEIYLDSY